MYKKIFNEDLEEFFMNRMTTIKATHESLLYRKAGETIKEIFDTLPDDIKFKLDDAINTQTSEMQVCSYEKGFKDGVNFMLDMLGKGKDQQDGVAVTTESLN